MVVEGVAGAVFGVALIAFVAFGLAKRSFVEKSVKSVGDEVDFFGDVGAKNMSRSFDGENIESKVLFMGEGNGPALE